MNLQELPFTQVQVQDGYWSPRLQTNAAHSIFHQYEMLEASGCIDNFRILLGEKEGFREGWFFADSDAYKWLDAAARLSQPEPRLAALVDGLIDLLGRAQSPDGYLFTYNQIHFPGQRWVNLQIEHELYCHGHLIEAAVSHHSTTGKTSLLEIGRKAADLVVGTFSAGGPERTPGHEEIEIALLRLYNLTRHAPYLKIARHFIEQRGRSRFFALAIARQNASVEARQESVRQQRRQYAAQHPEYAASRLPAGNFASQPPLIEQRRIWSALSGQFFQQHAPIRRQRVPVGHAVRFAYFQTAAAMLQRLQPDPSLLAAMEQAWEHMVSRRMYVTGGIGALPGIEGFGRDYELDPEFAYNETCAALASQFWSWELALATGKAQYSDLFEWQLYNASSVGAGLDGAGYLYNNPLACRGGVSRKPWYAVPCCPSNLSRTFASLGNYIFSAAQGTVWVHQYIGCQARLEAGFPLRLGLESGLPWSGKVRLQLGLDAPVEFTLHLRLPSWCEGQFPRLWLEQDGARVELPCPAAPVAAPHSPAAQGYDPRLSQFMPLRRLWQPGDVLEIEFPMPVCLRHAVPQVKGHAGRAAASRGPLVYCLESLDHPGQDIFSLRLQPGSLQPEFKPDLLGGVWALAGCTPAGSPLLLIPYNLWGNRGPSQMTVWIGE